MDARPISERQINHLCFRVNASKTAYVPVWEFAEKQQLRDEIIDRELASALDDIGL